jgi:predicted nucleic acid-binding protein
VITLDTSVVLSALDATDNDHDRVMGMIHRARGPYLLPVAVLSELTFMIERDYGGRKLEEFLGTIAQGQFVLDCGDHDIDRILELIRRYSDFPLGFADAAVVACGERNGGLIATLDFRHFGPIAREGTIQLAV